ncbi:MAG: hypothetical protein V4555_11675 [Acidobacteriota bacterium]
MLDVHPPHHPTHTWRDFFIHIATIVVGLLIAVGLEQSVETIHHSHQRHQLQEDLRGESERVHTALQSNFRTLALERIWLVSLRNDVDAMRSSHGQIKLPYRPRPAFDPADPTHAPLVLRWPPDGVWQTARESSLVGLLPRWQAEIYSGLALQHQLFAASTSTWIAEQTNLAAFEMRFNDAADANAPDLSRMSPADLDQYSAMLTRNLALRDTVVNRSVIYDASESAILDGATSRDALSHRILQQHPNFER